LENGTQSQLSSSSGLKSGFVQWFFPKKKKRITLEILNAFKGKYKYKSHPSESAKPEKD
jgi:hypothetical protein